VRKRRSLWLRSQIPLTDASGLTVAMRTDPTLADAIAKLSTRQRAVVALHYGYGFTFDEVASILKTRGGTVRSRLGRALINLRVKLWHASAMKEWPVWSRRVFAPALQEPDR
jgi:DNA-directed RNA polymerase specialized sigma24 family protein